MKCTPFPGRTPPRTCTRHFHSSPLAKVHSDGHTTPSCKVGWKYFLYSGQPWLAKIQALSYEEGKTDTGKEVAFSGSPGTLQVLKKYL